MNDVQYRTLKKTSPHSFKCDIEIEKQAEQIR